MLIVSCQRCHTAVRVLGEPSQLDPLVGRDSEFWHDKYVCVSCGQKGCQGLPEVDVDPEDLQKMKLRDLSPQEMYAAQMGLGTPDEMTCDLRTVRDLLENKRLKKIHGRNVTGTSRACLDELELEDGTKLHLGASAHGAVVFRISRAVSYTEKVLEDLDDAP